MSAVPSIKDVQAEVFSLGRAVESQALDAIVAGFSFASAVAWMDVVRMIISQVIRVPKNAANYSVLVALLTTILAVVVFMITKRLAGMQGVDVKKPAKPIYAVSA